MSPLYVTTAGSAERGHPEAEVTRGPRSQAACHPVQVPFCQPCDLGGLLRLSMLSLPTCEIGAYISDSLGGAVRRVKRVITYKC